MNEENNRMYSAVTAVTVIIAIFIFIITRFFSTALVIGISMEPTLHNGTMIAVTKITEEDDIKRGDIVIAKVADPKTGKSIQVIKRAIGIPGDRIQIKDGGLYINGGRKKTVKKIREPGKANEEISLSKDEYFLLGDNVNASGDSRMFGPVENNCIIGIYAGSCPW